MTYVDISNFIKSNLRYKQHWNTKVTMDKAQWQSLNEDTYIDGCYYAKGSQFKIFETTNFGWIVFDSDTRTPDGNIQGKRIIKW